MISFSRVGQSRGAGRPDRPGHPDRAGRPDRPGHPDRPGYSVAVAALVAGLALGHAVAAGAAETASIIVLTQIPCQFVEAENGTDHGFRTTAKADCEAVNARTGRQRLDRARTLRLKPGKYVFRVTNRNVPYELGFWLRSKGYDWRNPLHRFGKTSVSGGGLGAGETRDYAVALEPGEYLYSCPLNPTPDYRIVVTE